MKINFKEKTFSVPEDIDLLDPQDLAWVSALFEVLLEQYQNPLDIWRAVYDELFIDPTLTDKHKYAICVLFSSIITERYLNERFNETLANFAGVLQQIQGEGADVGASSNSRLILP